jgi:hypothetical protein
MSDPRKEAIIRALERFIRQRPGLEFCNYGDITSYRAEVRSITKDLRQARELLNAVAQRDSITADDIIAAAKSSFSGRLTIAARPCSPDAHLFAIEYCTGQYWPTEYRRAVAAVCAGALWERKRQDMPAPVSWRVQFYQANGQDERISGYVGIHEACKLKNENGNSYIVEYYRFPGSNKLYRTGDYIRAHFRRQFGRGIQERWFN